METDRSTRRLELETMVGKNRPLIVFAPSEDDPRFHKQRNALDDQQAGLFDREMLVIESFESGPGQFGEAPLAREDASALRQTFGVDPGSFAVVLIGKDGAEKHRWTEPLAAQEIFGCVDAMPTRKQEVHRRRHPEER